MGDKQHIQILKRTVELQEMVIEANRQVIALQGMLITILDKKIKNTPAGVEPENVLNLPLAEGEAEIFYN